MRCIAILAVLLNFCCAIEAHAVLERDGSNDSDYRALGETFAGRVISLRVTVPHEPSRYIGAVYLNSQFALTAAHSVDDFIFFTGVEYEASNGPNYLTDRDAVVPVSEVIFHPNWTYDAPPHLGLIDLAIIRFAQPLPGIPATIESAAIGESVTGAGWGQWGTPQSGLNPADGSLRAWHSPVDVNIFTNAEHFFAANFGRGSFPLDALNGNAAPGDSGGGAFDQDGNLIGITSSRVPNSISSSSQTHYLKLAHPDVYNWIIANTQVPEPSGFVMVACSLAGWTALRYGRCDTARAGRS
jgi:hypothetical protein